MTHQKLNLQLDEFSDEITIAELYSNLSPEEREEAEYYLNRYIELIERIYERTGG